MLGRMCSKQNAELMATSLKNSLKTLKKKP